MIGLFGLLQGMALLFALVGIGQWLAKDVFLNPKVIVGNETAAFFRAWTLFWDPSIYGGSSSSPSWRCSSSSCFAYAALELALAVLIVVLWVGLFFSFSQSSFVALVGGVLIAVALAVRSRTPGVAAAALLLAIPVGAAPPGAAAAPTTRPGTRPLFCNGIEIALDHPLVGVGIGAFQQAYAEKLDLKERDRRSPRRTRPRSPWRPRRAFRAAPALLVAAALATAMRGRRRYARTRHELGRGLAVAAIAVQEPLLQRVLRGPDDLGRPRADRGRRGNASEVRT